MHVISPRRGMGVFAFVLTALVSIGCAEDCPPPHRYDLDTHGYPICDRLTTRLVGTWKGVSIERTLETSNERWTTTPDGRRCFVDFFGADERKVPDASLIHECQPSTILKSGTPLQGSIRLPDDPTVYRFQKGTIIHYPWQYYVEDLRFLMVLDVGTLKVCTNGV
jgi:hypothetical protein